MEKENQLYQRALMYAINFSESLTGSAGSEIIVHGTMLKTAEKQPPDMKNQDTVAERLS